jgi:putative AlgH/UPF0301 family transcriptional regulator
MDILQAIAEGDGPDQCLLALGYAGWGPGQLDAEIKENGWLHVTSDDDLVFSPELDGLIHACCPMTRGMLKFYIAVYIVNRPTVFS